MKSNTYRMPIEARLALNAKKYLGHQRKKVTTNETFRDLKATIALQQCDYIVDGELVFLRKRRKNGEQYMIPLVVGGKRCEARALVTNIAGNGVSKSKRCADHIHAINVPAQQAS